MKYQVDLEYIHRGYEGDSNHKSECPIEYGTLYADTVEALYDVMAETNERWLAKRYIECKDANFGYRGFIEDYYIKFSHIYTVIEEFSKEKLKATLTFQEKTAIREEEAAKIKTERDRRRALFNEQKRARDEQADRDNYIRLQRKYGR